MIWVSSVCTTQVSRSKASASQFLPHNSAPMHFLRTISMQMDRESEEEQIGTHFVPRGAVFEGWGGVMVLSGLPLRIEAWCSLLFFAPPGRNKKKRKGLFPNS